MFFQDPNQQQYFQPAAPGTHNVMPGVPATQSQPTPQPPQPVPPPAVPSTSAAASGSQGPPAGEVPPFDDISDEEGVGVPDAQEVQKNDSKNIVNDMNKVLDKNLAADLNNNANNNVDVVDVHANIDVGHNVVDDVVEVNEDGSVKSVPVILYTENVKIPKLTNGQRITLAYDYCDIPERVMANERDEDEVVNDEGERLHTSFPKSELVDKMFDQYVQQFEKSAAKNLSGGAVPASNMYNLKPGFQISPTMENWAFKSHLQDFPQGVEFDGDVSEIKARVNDPLPKTILLKQEEFANLQKAASFQLRAASHMDWYRKSAKNGLDMALQNLDPESQQPLVKILQDCKQFLKGISYSTNLITRMGVYVHGGVTSTLRHDFLQKEGVNIPLEQKACLFSLPYGKALVFQGDISKIAQKVKEHRQEQSANRQLGATLKLADSVSKSGPKAQGFGRGQGQGQGQGRGRNMSPGVTTRAQFSGQQQNSNRGRGRDFYRQHSFDRGNNQGKGSSKFSGGSHQGGGRSNFNKSHDSGKKK